MHYKYFCFVVNNKDEKDFFIKKANNKGYSIYVSYVIEELNNYPLYFFVDIISKKITPIEIPFKSFDQSRNVSKIIETIDEFINTRIDDGVPIFKKVFNYTYVNNIYQLEKGLIKPTYEPKKIIRESVTGEISEIVVVIETLDDLYKILQIFNVFKFKVNNNKLKSIKRVIENRLVSRNESSVLFINLNYDDLSQSRYEFIKSKYYKNGEILDDPLFFGVYNKLLYLSDSNDLEKIKKFLIKSRLSDSPSYQPRKIIKESKDNFPYRFKTEEEIIREFGEDWKDTAFLDDNIGWGDGMEHLLGKVLELPYEDFKHNEKYVACTFFDEIMDRNWIIHWDMLTEINPKPSYKPREILKESHIDILFTLPPKTLTLDDQEKYFKVGDEVYIRPDAYKYFLDIDVQYMSKLYGKKGIITKITNMRDSYNVIEDYMFPEDILDDVNLDDLIIYVDVNGFGESSYYYWYYKCLISDKKSIPSYKPREIIKESHRYFPYRFKTMDEFYEEFGEYWFEERGPLGRYGWMEEMDINLGQVLPYTINEFLPKINDEIYKYFDKNDNWTETYLSTFHKAIDSEDKSQEIYWTMITDNEEYNPRPSYKPKTISRLDESTNFKYFEFVIEVNSDDEFLHVVEKLKSIGLNYRYYNHQNVQYPNWIYIDNNNNYNNFSLWDNSVELYYIKNYIRNYNTMYPEILTIDDIGKLGNYIKYGKFEHKPSYKPKKISRLDESIQDYNYKFKTKEELKEEFGENWMTDNFWVQYMNKFLGVVLPDIINDEFIENNKDIDYGSGLDYIILPQSIDRSGFSFALRTMKKIQTKPSYKPKKLLK